MKDIVIVEGPTGVGKTSLIARLYAAEPTLYVAGHYPAPAGSMSHDRAALFMWYQAAILHPALEIKRLPCILDRWIYSNGAYSAVFANQVRVDHVPLETVAKQFKTVVLFLKADAGVLYSRIHARNKPHIPKGVGDIRKLTQLVDRFAQEEKLCGLPKVGIRCHDEDLDSGKALAKALKAIRS